MINSNDAEKLVKSSQSANLLVQDLREMVSATDPLLGELAIEILEQAVEIEKRLKRIKAIASPETNTE
jgi:hypothetical protein